MIHDAKIDVSCDQCDDWIVLEPPVVFSDYSGNGSRYDTSDSTLNGLIKQQEWIIDSGAHFCSTECQKEHATEN